MKHDLGKQALTWAMASFINFRGSMHILETHSKRCVYVNFSGKKDSSYHQETPPHLPQKTRKKNQRIAEINISYNPTVSSQTQLPLPPENSDLFPTSIMELWAPGTW